MVTIQKLEKQPLIKLKDIRTSYNTPGVSLMFCSVFSLSLILNLLFINKIDESTRIYTRPEYNLYNLRSNGVESNGHHSRLDSEKITFSWSEINVFTLEQNKTKGNIQFKDNNNQVPSRGKHILKNGKINSINSIKVQLVKVSTGC